MYFITICTQNHTNLFGEIPVGAESISAQMNLNDAGKMIEKIWHKIPDDFDNTRLHEFIIMPNHIHGIIEISAVGAPLVDAQNHEQSLGKGKGHPQGDAPTVGKTVGETVGNIVGAFKS